MASQPGLYFVGLHFLYAATSETVTGVPATPIGSTEHLLARRKSRTAVTAMVPSL